MIFKRFYDDQLAQASYMLACEATGAAMIVDPNRDAAFYIAEAARERLRIAYVTETHIHADFLSGSRELARATSAQLLLSDEGGEDWRYAFAMDSDATLLRDGATVTFGKVQVRAMHTPGHTPEHLAFLVTDHAVSSEPLGMLSGDFIFVGDVGRPDLLEKAANKAGTMEVAARTLFKSLQRISSLPDYLQIWPGHGAGSACGKALGAMPQTTLGFERISNWALQQRDEDTFVRGVLEAQPSPPRYFGVMKEMNKKGPAILGELLPPVQLGLAELEKHCDARGMVVDLRLAAAFAESHMPSAISIPLNKSFTKYAGSVIPYDRDLVLVVRDSQSDAKTAARSLAMIGLDRVRGYVTESLIGEWKSAGRATERLSTVTSGEAARMFSAGGITILDVRDKHELDAGRIPGTQNISLSVLADRMKEVPADIPVLVVCQTGNRSAIAGSMLKAGGVREVHNLIGGFVDWQKNGLQVETV